MLEGKIWKICVIIMLLFINAYFVVLEFALVQIRPSRLNTLVADGKESAKKGKHIKDNINSYLSATQLGITLVGLLLGSLGEPTISGILGYYLKDFNISNNTVTLISVTTALILLTVLEVIFGELVPKAIALYKAEQCTLALSGSLIIFHKLTYPIIWVFDHVTNACLKPFGLSVEFQEPELFTREELELLIRDNIISEAEKELLNKAFKFQDKIASDVMVHRKKMVCISKDATQEEVIDIISNNGYTRYPVIGEDKDDVIGFVHVRDIYRDIVSDNKLDLDSCIREVPHFLEATDIYLVFTKLKEKKEQFAIIIDEFGGTSGLLTLEDIVEEIVGDIKDEFDE